MSIKDKFIKDLSYEELRFQQLHTAHQSTLLVYARVDRNDKEAAYLRELSRKLRPEFSKVYVASQVRECFKLVRKHDGDENLPSIDIILADVDSQSLKFLEAINKRPKQKETANLPLISTIMLLPEDASLAAESRIGLGPNTAERDAEVMRASIEAAGGANAILPHSATTKTILTTALELLSRRKGLEEAFRELKAAKMKAAKYPYLPIFSSKNNQTKNDDDDDDDDDDPLKFNESSASTHRQRLKPVAGSDGSTVSVSELSDWTETQSMLPSCVNQNRERMSTKMNILQTGSPVKVSVGDRLKSQELKERQVADRNIVKFIQSGRALSELAGETARMLQLAEQYQERLQDGADELEADDKSAISHVTDVADAEVVGLPPAEGSPLQEPSAARSSILSKSATSPVCTPGSPTGKSRKSMLSEAGEGLELLSSKKRNAAMHVARAAPKGIGAFLDPKLRPTWQGARPIHTAPHDGTRRRMTDESLVSGAHEVVDLHPFIKREPPPTNLVHTVGGLNKAQAFEQWKIINSSNHEEDHSETVSLESQLGHGSTTHMNTRLVAYLEKQDKDRQKVSADNEAGQGVLSPRLEAGGRRRQMAVDPLVLTQATKTLKKMAREIAPDVQLNDLLPVVLTSGKVSVGDKDILDAGLKAESEGNFEVAISMYKRAGLHTAKPHLSKMFLAFIHYRMRKFMQALDYLTWAINSQEKIKHLSTFCAEEQFIAYFNRGLVNFRLGNDDKGILDMKCAIDLQPTHLKAKEVLSLALRRVTKYGESIDLSKMNIIQRKEQEVEEQERLAQLKATEEAHAKARKERQMKHQKQGRARGQSSSMIGEASAFGERSNRSRERSRDGSSSPVLGDDVRHASSSLASDYIDDKVLEVYCPVQDKQGHGSLKSRSLQRSRQVIEQEQNTSSMPGEALKTFKLTNGFPDNLYEGLFDRPSELQDAMMVAPELRSDEQLATIASKLRLFPFLWKCSDSTMLELCRCVEYRALQNRANLYHQNNRADGVCFLLRGSVQGKLESLELSGSGNKLISEILPREAIGHIDLLFDSGSLPAPKEIFNSILKAKREKAAQVEKEFSNLNVGTATGVIAENKSNPSSKEMLETNSLDDFNNVLEEEDKRESDEETDIDEANLPRCLQNKMFVTYSMTGQCEMLICKKEDFNRLLYNDAYEELKRRISIVEGCRVFSDWSQEEKIRLARMGQVQVHHSGDVILKQGVKPQQISLIMKGMCKSYKYPNKSTVLETKLFEAKEKAARHDLKYTYHHKQRDQLSKGVLIPPAKASEKHKRNLAARTHVTVSEAIRYSLGIEIKHLEKELAKAKEAERLQEEESSIDDISQSLSSTLSEIRTLQWPQLFGEACVLDPENGTTRGTIIADTTLEVLNIHKSQLQTFRIRENMLEKLKYRCVVYPEDEELLLQKERKAMWEVQRQDIVGNLSKKHDEYLEPFYV